MIAADAEQNDDGNNNGDNASGSNGMLSMGKWFSDGVRGLFNFGT
jgi:hypothetical protein